MSFRAARASDPASFDWRTFLTVAGSSLSLLGVAIGLYFAVHSSLFTLQVVEIADLPEQTPVDEQTLNELVDLPLGRWNLFALDLDPIEKRILSHPWIRSVDLHKRFPQTLTISVAFREPRALFQSEHGKLSYIDRDGHVFGEVNLSRQPDLPLVSGISIHSPEMLERALKILSRWENAPVGSVSQVSSLDYEGEKGFRVWVTYLVLPRTKGQPARRARALVELGQEIDVELEAQLERLQAVFKYLSSHGVSARQVWADAGKKVVVRVARDS